jgi:hypothetical protein
MKSRVRTHPYCPDQVIGVFFVLGTLSNYMLEPLEAAMTGMFTLGFITAYCLIFSYKFTAKIAKYFKGIKK